MTSEVTSMNQTGHGLAVCGRERVEVLRLGLIDQPVDGVLAHEVHREMDRLPLPVGIDGLAVRRELAANAAGEWNEEGTSERMIQTAKLIGPSAVELAGGFRYGG